MRKILTTLICISLFSCSTKKAELSSMQKFTLASNISSLEKTILNQFLTNEIKKDKYSFSNEVIVIEEAIPTIKNIEAYQSAYIGYHLHNKPTLEDNNRLGWVIDSIQIMKRKNETKKEKKYLWEKSNFINENIKIMQVKSFKKMLNEGTYLQMNESLIIYVSRPLILDENNALISFSCGSSKLGFTEITHFTALLKKIKNHWLKTIEYSDGVIN
ncbi:hypothetical protein [Flavobacterium sp. RS13.1]|uniref:hypothetical protein n=1 Tax=Flavobacterium sp. RS13.1 TaxID=3400345 RepID=UPI003AAA9063